MSGITKPVVPLANPKGVKHVCELCGKPAFVQCAKCKVTYYCSHEHQRIDWVGIHEQICTQVAILKGGGLPFLGSEEEREKRRQDRIDKQIDLIKICRTMGQKLLFEKRYEEAIPAALQSLKHSIDVYGTASIELVISYLILAEASIGLAKLDQAEQYLSQAEWTVLKTPDVGNDFKAKLYRNLGLLYDAKNNAQESLRNFANGIYYASEEYGTDDIRTSSGYYYMANVFLKQGKPEITASLFKQVCEIWKARLSEICQKRLAKPQSVSRQGVKIADKKKEKATTEENDLDEAQKAEARNVLYSVLQYNTGANAGNDVMLNVMLAIAYLEFYSGNQDEARRFFADAKELITSGGKISPELEPTCEQIDLFLTYMSNYGQVASSQTHLRPIDAITPA